MSPGNWFVYMIICSDQSLYTGITTDPERRFREHVTGCGAKYFRGRQPVRMVYLELRPDRSDATKRELEIKRLNRTGKCVLISAEVNGIDRFRQGDGDAVRSVGSKGTVSGI